MTRLQLKNLGVDEKSFEIFYMNGPIKVASPGIGLEGDGVDNVVSGPFYQWYTDESTPDEILSMIASVLTFIETNQIDGIYGFSQAMIGSISAQSRLHLGSISATSRRHLGDIYTYISAASRLLLGAP